jgi:mono/diheme cytochrome c family protein
MRIRRFTALGATLVVAGLIACAGEAADEAAPADTAETPAPAPDAAATPVDTPPAGAAMQLPEGVTQVMVDAGKQAFETTICYTCHGMDGSGTPLAPNLRDDTWLNTDGTMAGIEQVIRNGVPTPVEHPAAMPPMGGAQLSDEQIQNLTAYVYAISHGG